MSDIAISVENLSKSYLVGHNVTKAEHYSALRDVIARSARELARKTRDMLKGRAIVQGQEVEEFWALKDVSFEIRQGDRVGLIGRNGAGKSTLLKILSRITAPTTGRAKIVGRVASLLEVGTGFHPELSGRENIFLNGAVLGMSHRDIQRKFDEIVSFSEIERFLDTPVKRYSSGMYVRLAFAVAAHLEPQILIVDEVLAVGDAAFQKKCLGKMEEVGNEGKAVLFVSHNMGLIQQLCDTGIWIDNGKIKQRGDISEVVSAYLDPAMGSAGSCVDLTAHPGRLPHMGKYLTSIRLLNSQSDECLSFSQADTVNIVIQYVDVGGQNFAGAGFIISTRDGIRVGSGNTYMVALPPHFIPSAGQIVFSVPARQLTPGTYLVTVSIGRHQSHLSDKVENCIAFDVLQSDIYGTGYLLTKEDGVAALNFSCTVK